MPKKDCKRVLIIDDDPDFLKLLSVYLVKREYITYAVGSVEEAIALLKEESFDVVLLDNQLPGMMGLEAIPKIADLTRAAIIMMSGISDDYTADDSLLLGAKSFLKKPFELAALTRSIQSTC